MQNPWWLAISVGLSSGALGALVTYTFNYKKERSQYLRQKAEELYMAVHHFERWVTADVIIDLTGRNDNNSSVDDASHVAAAAQSYRNVTAIAEVYFPHLVPLVNAVLDARDQLHSAKKSADLRDQIAPRALNFSDAVKSIKSKVAKQCRHPMHKITYLNIINLPWN